MVTETDILLRALKDDNVLKKHIDEINEITKEFPYFQPAWLASVHYLKLRNTFFSPVLQQAAARTIDRGQLFEFVNKVRKPEILKENTGESFENPVKEKSILPESKAIPVEKNKTVSKETVKEKAKPVNKAVHNLKTDINKKEEPVKNEIVEKKDQQEKEQSLVKKNNPVKIIRPIPRTITNAIPKKLIQKPEKDTKQEVDSKPDNVTDPKIEQKHDIKEDPGTKIKLELKKEQEVVDTQLSSKKKKNVEPDEKLSYAEWLQRFSQKQKKSNIDLIEKFLQERPKIIPKKNVSIKPPEIIEESVAEKQMLMTETLANLYVKQKKYEKAIQAFRILSLKYPKKSSYFANQIKEIEQKLK